MCYLLFIMQHWCSKPAVDGVTALSSSVAVVLDRSSRQNSTIVYFMHVLMIEVSRKVSLLMLKVVFTMSSANVISTVRNGCFNCCYKQQVTHGDSVFKFILHMFGTL